MTRKMKDQIQCRKKLHPGQTEAEKWEAIYKILFPDEVVPDPCELRFLSPCRFPHPRSLRIYIVLKLVTNTLKILSPYQITTSNDKDVNLQTQ